MSVVIKFSTLPGGIDFDESYDRKYENMNSDSDYEL